MAVWQIYLDIIQKDKIENKSPEEICNKKDYIIAWERKIIINALNGSFVKEKSWSRDIEQFGNLEESCIEVYHINEALAEISARIDVRTATTATLLSLLDFINENDAFILIENTPYEATKENLALIIKDSRAYEFCNNPEKFLMDLKLDLSK